jgi:hypothetical protein
MDSILCPKCGKLANFLSYFRKYYCNKCHWKSGKIKSRLEKIDDLLEELK